MIYKVLVFTGYIIPYGFLAVYGDFTYGSMVGYLSMMIILGVLSYILLKRNNLIVVVLGNILNLISSLVVLSNTVSLDWEYYFKPLSSTSIIIMLNIIGVLIQYIIYRYIKKNE